MRRAPFGRKRHQRGRVAQGRTVIDAAKIELRLGLRRNRVERGEIDAVGARLVAQHGERGGELRLGDRRLNVVELGIGDVAQVADRGHAIARQHIERISEIAAAVLARVGSACHVITQPVERLGERLLRHLEMALARPRKEVGDVGVEPGIVTTDRPQAKRAVRILPRQQTLNGVLDALVDVAVERELGLRGELIDIEHRHRAASDLLGAAERITVKLVEQRGDVERGRDRDRQADAAGARHEVGEHVLRQRQSLARSEGADSAARQDLVRRPHVERIAARQHKSVWTCDVDLDGTGPRPGCRHRN